MARQGQSFATAEPVRVIYPLKSDDDEGIVDVPKDGATIGEVVTKGNIVMKEVFGCHCIDVSTLIQHHSTFVIQMPLVTHSEVATSTLGTLQYGIRTVL